MTTSQIVTVGTSHHIAPLDFREQLSFSENQLTDAFQLLRERHHLRESVILSTCNRVEIHAVSNRGDASAVLSEFLSNYHQIELQQLDKFTYRYHNLDAIRHLFNVSST